MSKENHQPPIEPVTKPDKNFQEAKQLFAEMYGDLISRSTYTNIIIFGLVVLCIGLVWLNFRTRSMVENFRPRIIRINDIGRAEAVTYDSLNYKPKEPEIKYFLTQFCQLYYSRNPYTIKDNFRKFPYFLDGDLANSILDTFSKNKVLTEFLSNTNTPRIRVKVNRVILTDITKAPYKASVDFQEDFISPATGEVINTDKYTASFVFVFRDKVPDSMIPINPLGFTITYFREDKAFK